MKNALVLILLLLSSVCYCDILRGTWKGKGYSADFDTIKIEFTVMRQKDSIIGVFLTEPTYFSLADSSFNGTDLHLISSKLQLRNRNKALLEKKAKGEQVTLYEEIKFDGVLTLDKNHLKGKFTYLGKVYQADLYRGNYTAFRPQELHEPFPYESEHIKFINKKDSVVLYGTLTKPNKKGKFPAVILKGGGSPTNRDAEGNNHKPYLLLADYLTRHGIAVLRYDDRGIEKSTGNFWNSTALDFAGDLNAGFEFLASRNDIKSDQIGLLGQSEGGMVASMAASQNKDFKFVVMLAGPGIPLREVFAFQLEEFYKAGDLTKTTYDFRKHINIQINKFVDQNMNSKAIIDSLEYYRNELIRLTVDSTPENPEIEFYKSLTFIIGLNQKGCMHNLFNLKVNPADYMEKLTCPVLSLNGSYDQRVDAKINQQAIRQALIKAGNKDFTIVELEGLNHSFQECKIGTIKEAQTLEQTFSPKALEIITQWIEEHVEK